MAASRGEAFVGRRVTYQDVLEAPVHQVRQDRRWDAVHPFAARTATYTGKIGARRKDRPSLRFRRWGPGRVVDPRRTGVAPRRRRPRAGSCGVAPGTDRGSAPYAVLSPCAGLGVRGAVALRREGSICAPSARPARERVGHQWLVDPTDRTLEEFELRDAEWMLIACAKDDEPVSIRPVDAITWRSSRLTGKSGQG